MSGIIWFRFTKEESVHTVVEGSFDNPRQVTLKWFKPIPYSELDRWLDDYYEVLYFVYQGKGRQARTRHYLGQAYSQDVVQRLKHSEHKIHGIAKKHVGVKVSFGELYVVTESGAL